MMIILKAVRKSPLSAGCFPVGVVKRELCTGEAGNFNDVVMSLLETLGNKNGIL